MKIWPYILIAVALPTLFLIYIISLGHTPLASAVLNLPNETEILLCTVFAIVGAATVGHFLGYRRVRKNSSERKQNRTRRTINLKYIAIFIAVLALFIIPFIINQNAEFSGTDGQGPDAIEETGYNPWIGPLGYEPDDLGERLFFSMQVGIGGGILGFFVGHEMGKAVTKKEINSDYMGD